MSRRIQGRSSNHLALRGKLCEIATEHDAHATELAMRRLLGNAQPFLDLREHLRRHHGYLVDHDNGSPSKAAAQLAIQHVLCNRALLATVGPVLVNRDPKSIVVRAIFARASRMILSCGYPLEGISPVQLLVLDSMTKS